ncbi:zinc finger BED domain-containing protein 4-like [Hemicordylus capensis]|uniref:zinc finger BED domain-containing protein 4-like n=1 Tax=Hemicordylus capensis TaxID=884348 RepID=UPI0023044DBB|nr:zinc finger BED domain-containing protein 4-like [Hemicordylus capensis]XP_053140673.1 zinc finger BED domain-containing protein 4-like [Hemicordylus capensis]XP_053140674.1 zinc finger BED domain-containing protein 4-like [Hemicordylus capensis]XP_053140675.1 zinc finger BED domain-containing protein 4-like [Hemicordylus capensis]
MEHMKQTAATWSHHLQRCSQRAESSLPELTLPDVLNVLPEEEDLFCSISQLDEMSRPPMHPGAVTLSASSATSHHGSARGPVLHYTSASESNATFLGHQRGQILPTSENASAAELGLEHQINGAIEQLLKRSLCPVVHFTIDVRATGPTTGYMFIMAHLATDRDGVLHRCQAVMAMCEVEQSNLTEILSHKLREVKDKWLRPLQLEVGYVTTATKGVEMVVAGACLGCIFPPVHCIYLLLKRVMEKVKDEDVHIGQLFQALCKISIHFEQSPGAHNRLLEIQLLCGLPQELLKEKMPTPSNNLFLLMHFLLARQNAFSAYLMENPELNLTCQQWRLLHHLACLLKPCEDTITTIRREHANLGQVLHELWLLESTIKGCFQQLQEEADAAAAAAAVTLFATELLQSLEGHSILAVVRENILYQTATLLHPYFRDHICEYLKGDVHLQRWQLKKHLMQQIKKEYLNFSSAYATSSLTEVASQELESYLQDNIDLALSRMDPLFYWNTRKHMWPFLSTVAFQYFSCLPAPVFLEEVLSIEDLMISERF